MTKQELINALESVSTDDLTVPVDAVARYSKYLLDECERAVAGKREPDYTDSITCIHFGGI